MIYRIKHPLINRLYEGGVPEDMKDKAFSYKAVIKAGLHVMEEILRVDLPELQKVVFMEAVFHAANNGNRLPPETLKSGLPFPPQLDRWLALGLLEAVDEGGQVLSPEKAAQIASQAPSRPSPVRVSRAAGPTVDELSVYRAWIIGKEGHDGQEATSHRERFDNDRITKTSLKAIKTALKDHTLEEVKHAAAYGWLDQWSVSHKKTDLAWFLKIDPERGIDNVEKFSQLGSSG